MDNPRIRGVEWARLESKRPRPAGANARLGAHGDTFALPLVRLTTEDGASGFGFSGAAETQLAALLGKGLQDLFSPHSGVTEEGRAVECALWDLAGQRLGQPVYRLAANAAGMEPPDVLRVPCYDTSLYFDDLHLTSSDEAAELMAAEIREGYARGHRAFKLKVGRGARHLPVAEGTSRDIAVIRAAREAMGQMSTLLLDANNGYTLNLAKRVLEETADCGIYWLEEAFQEDAVLYRDLKEWLARHGLMTRIADGEGDASPHLLTWAREGWVDVVQYDFFGYGLSRWLRLGAQLDTWGVRSAPHHYGTQFGNYAAGHLAAGVRNFAFVEWDEAATPALDTAAYILKEGFVTLPTASGFGLSLDEAAFRRSVKATGGCLRL
jgi:L-rhamnonate dehydratase